MSGAIREGYLRKRASVTKVWKKRYVILLSAPKRLEIYSERGKELRRAVRLDQDAKVVELPFQKHKRHCFSLQTLGSEIFLAADSEDDLHQWVSEILMIALSARKTTVLPRAPSASSRQPSLLRTGSAARDESAPPVLVQPVSPRAVKACSLPLQTDPEDMKTDSDGREASTQTPESDAVEIKKPESLQSPGKRQGIQGDLFPCSLVKKMINESIDQMRSERSWILYGCLSSCRVLRNRFNPMQLTSSVSFQYMSQEDICSIIFDLSLRSSWSLDQVLEIQQDKSEQVVQMRESERVSGKFFRTCIPSTDSLMIIEVLIEGEASVLSRNWILSTDSHSNVHLDFVFELRDSPGFLSYLNRFSTMASDWCVHWRTEKEIKTFKCLVDFIAKSHRFVQAESKEREIHFRGEQSEDISLQDEKSFDLDDALSDTSENPLASIKFMESNAIFFDFDQQFPFGIKDYERAPEGGLLYTNQEEVQKQRWVAKDLIKSMGSNLFQGKSLTSISMPVKIFEPRSFLQRMTDTWCYAPLFLKKASLESDPLERIKYCISFAFAGLHRSLTQLKPFNPILGETFQARFSDGTRLYLEQVSHHPPISAYQVLDGDGKYKMYGAQNYEPSISINSATGTQAGINTM